MNFYVHAAKVISHYLRPLCTNEYFINNTQKFPNLLPSIPLLQGDEVDVSYDVESLFTNFPIEETINYITDKIYVHKKVDANLFETDFQKIIDKTCYGMYF